MEKQIKLRDRNISYTLKVNNKAQGLRLIIKAGGICVVTTPKYMPQFIINKFLSSKSEWLIEKIDYLSKFKPVERKNKKRERKEYLKYKDQALILVKNRLAYFNQYYNFKWNDITIKNQKTRWGSCSRLGNLNFNYKIALLSEDQADYIVVHELCHLLEFNHSKNFWALVAKTIPKHQTIRRSLKRSGLDLS